jgi:hypothetical protein
METEKMDQKGVTDLFCKDAFSKNSLYLLHKDCHKMFQGQTMMTLVHCELLFHYYTSLTRIVLFLKRASPVPTRDLWTKTVEHGQKLTYKRNMILSLDSREAG